MKDPVAASLATAPSALEETLAAQSRVLQSLADRLSSIESQLSPRPPSAKDAASAATPTDSGKDSKRADTGHQRNQQQRTAGASPASAKSAERTKNQRKRDKKKERFARKQGTDLIRDVAAADEKDGDDGDAGGGGDDVSFAEDDAFADDVAAASSDASALDTEDDQIERSSVASSLSQPKRPRPAPKPYPVSREEPADAPMPAFIRDLPQFILPDPGLGVSWFTPQMTKEALNQAGSFVGWVKQNIPSFAGDPEKNHTFQEALSTASVLDEILRNDAAMALERGCRRLKALQKYAHSHYKEVGWLSALSATKSVTAPVPLSEWDQYEKKAKAATKEARQRQQQQHGQSQASRYPAAAHAGSVAAKKGGAPAQGGGRQSS